MSSPRTTVTIDRITLRGIDPLDRKAFVAGLEAALRRQLAHPATRASITAKASTDPRKRTQPVVRLGRLLTPQPGLAGARALGTSIGAAIGRALGKQVGR
jgi:hypothetical protein